MNLTDTFFHRFPFVILNRMFRAGQQLGYQFKCGLLRWGGRLLGPERAAALACLRLDMGNFRTGRPTVLCLSRPHFSIDVEQLRSLDHLNWVSLNLIMLGEIQRAWAAPAMQQQTFFQNTLGVEVYAARWKLMVRFARALLQGIGRRCDLRGVLCANIDYWQSEALRIVARERGIPFLVLSRENLLTDYDDRLVRERYSGFHFSGDACAVFGRWIGDTLVRAGCIRQDQIVVTGAPRLDVWKKVTSQETARDKIVLLSFADPNYYAPQAFHACLRRFVAAAARHSSSGLTFVVKAKNKEDRLAILRMCGDRALPERLVVTERVSLEELLPRARLIIGFNTMALFDALFTHSPIAVPDWLDTRRGREYLMFQPDDALCREVLRFFGNEQQLDRLLDEAAASDYREEEDIRSRHALIERYVHLPQEATATELVERFVVDRLDQKANTQSQIP